MHNNFYFLRQLARELNLRLQNSELLTCFSQEKDEVILGFSNETYIKCILKPNFSTLMVLGEFARARKNSVSLWPELYLHKVKLIRVCENERALRIELENDYTLIIKFFGNRPNLLVYQKSEQIFIFNNRLLTDRNLDLNDFDREMNASFEDFVKNEDQWPKLFFTLGKKAIEEIQPVLNGLNSDQKWDRINDFIAHLEIPDFYIDYSSHVPALSLFRGEIQPSAIDAINNFGTAFQKTSTLGFLKNELTNKLVKDISKTKNYISKTHDKQQALKTGVKNEETGHIIMANLHAIPPGSESVELLNFYTNEPVKIRLKKDLSPQKNAEVYYRKSKNEKVEADVISKNLSMAHERLSHMERLLEIVEDAGNLKELRPIQKEILIEKNDSSNQEIKFHEFLFEGVIIWVGRNAKNNDLLLKTAHKNDIWLHARDTTGSHVIIKNPKPTANVIEYAASLAAYYSKRRNEGLVAVIFTPRKFVRKAKNLAAGQVIVDKEETILVKPSDGKI